MNVEKTVRVISDYNRFRKFSFFLEYFKPAATTTVLDVGPSEAEYLKHANILEKKYPYPERITALSIEDLSAFSRRYPKTKAVTYDGTAFPFKDREFDICWCSAVIEHVGSRDKQAQFLAEISRVAKSAFITTPNRYSPIEIHTRICFLHYLPKKIFDRILILLAEAWASGDYMHLMSYRDAVKLCKQCGIDEFKVIRNKIFGITGDFMIIIRA